MRQVFFAVAVALIVAQFTSLLAFTARIADHSAIVGVGSDDAANAVQVTLRSQWWSNNDFTPYGPVYFRLANSLRQLAPWPSVYAVESVEGRELAAHFAMTLVSLLSAFALALVLAFLLWSRWSARLLMTALLTAAFLHNPVWSKMLLTAHPDWLFSLFVTLALIFTLESMERPENLRLFKTAAILWGVAGSIKLTIVLFVPVFVFMWGRPWDLAIRKQALRFAGWMAIGFFAIGFPQNFLLPKMIKFLSAQSRLSVSPGPDDLLDWVRLFADQLWLPALVLITGWLVLGGRESRRFRYGKKTLLRAVFIIAVPTLWMISRKVLSPFDYYPMPFVAMLLALLALGLRHWTPPNFPKAFPAVFALGLLAMRMTLGFVPPAMGEMTEAMQKCRPEARVVYGKVKAWIAKGHKVHVDPYTPYPNGPEYRGILFREWFNTWELMDRRDVQIAVFSSSFYSRYLPDTIEAYVKIENSSWEASRDFYRSVRDKAEATSPQGHVWHKIDSDSCGFEFWQRD